MPESKIKAVFFDGFNNPDILSFLINYGFSFDAQSLEKTDKEGGQLSYQKTKLSTNTQLSVIIPCKNEEANIERCIKSVKWIDEKFVIDSQSTDKTTRIAEKLGAKVFQFKYKGGWPKKKNGL